MRGILMIEPLYHQTIAGNKTMTRRSGGLEVVNVEMDFLGEVFSPDNWELAGYRFNSGVQFAGFINRKTNEEVECRARYKFSENLYLKEPYKTIDPPTYIEYAFDKPKPTYESGVMSNFKGMGYENKLFMPVDFAREFIRITEIKCERLFDISDDDCIAEGIVNYSTYEKLFGYYNYLSRDYASYDIWELNPRESFISLYKLANKIKPTAEITNLWVWVYSYEYLNGYKP